jgi:hypothetical protein
MLKGMCVSQKLAKELNLIIFFFADAEETTIDNIEVALL